MSSFQRWRRRDSETWTPRGAKWFPARKQTQAGCPPGEDPKLAARLYRLAYIYAARGRHNDAEPLYERSLAIQEGLNNANPRIYAGTLLGVAGYYLDDLSDDERVARGIELRKRALEALETIPDLGLTEMISVSV